MVISFVILILGISDKKSVTNDILGSDEIVRKKAKKFYERFKYTENNTYQ